MVERYASEAGDGAMEATRSTESKPLVALTLALALAVALLSVPARPASAQEEARTAIIIDSTALTVTGDDDDPKAINGVPFVASVQGGVATFYVKGDLNIAATDDVRAVGANAVSLRAGNDASIAQGATFDVSASGTTPGPGGGRGAEAARGGGERWRDEFGNNQVAGSGHPLLAWAGAGGWSNSQTQGGGGGGGGMHGNCAPFVGYEGGDGQRGQDGQGGGYAMEGAPLFDFVYARGHSGLSGTTNQGGDGVGGQGGGGGQRGFGGGTIFGGSAPTQVEQGQDGAAGTGGAGGNGRYLDGTDGGNGTDGGEGAPGKNGPEGGNGQNGKGGGNRSVTPNLTGGGGGGSGGGGGMGSGGSAGGRGAGGGGGGGAGANCANDGQPGGRGGDGGFGGTGGMGGVGGKGAAGGSGGGALEVSALGRIDVAGVFAARGSEGSADFSVGQHGGSGFPGQSGRPGEPGGVKEGDSAGDGGDGGAGGRGGHGGNGGKGGDGGMGGGGAGGTIKISGSVVVGAGQLSVDTSGGTGGVPGVNDGGNGRFVLASNTATTGLNPTLTKAVRGDYAGPRKANPFVSGNPNTPYLPDLQGDAEAYGLLEGISAEDFPAVRSGAPDGSPAALHRLDRLPDGHNFAGFDALLYLNLSGRSLPSPAMGAGEAGFDHELFTGGFATDPAFGGSGPGTLSEIQPGEVYATLVPEGTTEEFGFSYNRSGVARSASAEALQSGETIYLSRFPDTGITAGPQGLTNDATPSFEFSSEEGNTFECRMDSTSEAAFESCSSPFTSKTLAEGDHTFEVRATDLDGNTDQTPASRSITVDSKAPVVKLDAPTDRSATNDPTPDFSGTAGTVDGDSDEVRVELYAGNETTGTPAETLNLSRATDGSFSGAPSTDLSNGTYTAVAVQEDAIGNEGRSAPLTFIVDTRAPVVSISSSSRSEDATPTFELSSDENPSTFECRLDSTNGAEFKPCTSPFTASRLKDGNHTLEVRATDRANNTGEAATQAFTVETLPSVINDDEYSTEEDRRLIVSAAGGVLKNDTDAENDPLAATKLSDPQHGAVTLEANGSFTYSPDDDYNGTDSFTYKANDGTKDGARTATVTVKIKAANDAPAFDKGADRAFREDSGAREIAGWATNISPGPSDESGQSVSFTTTTDKKGLFSKQPSLSADGTLSFSPARNASGRATVTVVASDTGGTANGGDDTAEPVTIRIRVEAVNDAPVARDDSYRVREDGGLRVRASGVLKNDSDVDLDRLSAQRTSGPGHGKLTFKADGSFVYEPRADYNGRDSFTYRVSDGEGGTDVAKVTIRVRSAPDHDGSGGTSADAGGPKAGTGN